MGAFMLSKLSKLLSLSALVFAVGAFCYISTANAQQYNTKAVKGPGALNQNLPNDPWSGKPAQPKPQGASIQGLPADPWPLGPQSVLSVFYRGCTPSQ